MTVITAAIQPQQKETFTNTSKECMVIRSRVLEEEQQSQNVIHRKDIRRLFFLLLKSVI